MADKRISDLPQAEVVDSTSKMPVERDGTAQHITGAQLAQFAIDSANQATQGPVGEAKTAAEEAKLQAQNSASSAAASENSAKRSEAAVVNAPTTINGTWWVYDKAAGKYVDTGVEATGPRGEPFEFEDFTEEQLESLRGPQGIPGSVTGDVDNILYMDLAEYNALATKDSKTLYLVRG